MSNETADKTLITRFLHLFLLINLAVCYPMLQSASSHAEFLVAHSVTGFDLILLVGVLCFAIPAVLLVLELPAPRFIHIVFVAVLTTILLLPALKKLPDSSGFFTLALAAVLGCLVAWGSVRINAVSQTMRFVSPFALLIPILFFWNPSVRSVLSEPGTPRYTNISSTVPVVMILFDELPLTSLLDDQGNIDEVRYPNFSRLSKESTWLRNATTCSSLTEFSVPALLSGMYPDEKRVPVLKDYPNNLFTLLGGNYEMHVQEAITRLWPEKGKKTERFSLLLKDVAAVYLHGILPAPFTDNLPSVTEKWANFWNESDQDRRDIFQSFIDNLKPSADRAPLYFLHVMLPHKPWIYLPSGKEYRDYGSLVWGTAIQNRGVWLNDAAIVEQYWKRHLLQVGFVDLMLGRLIQKLKSVGLYDSCLLVVTSDHGVGFWPNESLRKAASPTMQDILYIPLFMKFPHQVKGETIDRRVETIDILPTIADAINISIPWKTNGTSAVDPSRPERRKRTRVRGNDRLVRFESDLTTEDPSFQKRVKTLGARSPFSEFFKISSTTFEPADQNDYSIHLINAQAFEKVDLASNYVPCFIPGIIDSDEKELNLMIRINGEPRAITRTFPIRNGQLRFAALVPESSFHQGKNKVEVVVLKK